MERRATLVKVPEPRKVGFKAVQCFTGCVHYYNNPPSGGFIVSEDGAKHLHALRGELNQRNDVPVIPNTGTSELRPAFL